MKTNWFSILKYNRFAYGDQVVSQIVLFECKFLFSIIFFYFHKSYGCQDRYHTHAFNAISFKLFGNYNEYVLDDEDTGEYHVEIRNTVVKYFARDRYHKIGDSNGCMTILLAGPWKRKWKEWQKGITTYYTWGRKK